ncbi:MAG: GyrI-like domain-containing protein [Pseudolysinimonas sp.]
MDTIKFTDDHELYQPSSTEFVDVDVPEFRFLILDGHGAPAEPEFVAAIESLMSLSYSVKFASRLGLKRDYSVAPIETLWGEEIADLASRREDWTWRMLVRQPEWIDTDFVEACRARSLLKAPGVAAVRFEPWEEGRCVQIMHIGSYDTEAPTIARLHAEYLPQHGLVPNGPHHEIYLSDPRRTSPNRLRTVIRQAVRPE